MHISAAPIIGYSPTNSEQCGLFHLSLRVVFSDLAMHEYPVSKQHK
jgi:hypothetical protein